MIDGLEVLAPRALMQRNHNLTISLAPCLNVKSGLPGNFMW